MRLVSSDSRGFSLLELLVAMIILSVLSAVAAPGVSRMMENYRVKATSRQLISDLQFAKMKAVTENTNYQIFFDIANARYRVEKSDDPTNCGQWRSLGDTTNPYYAKGVSLTKSFTGDLVVFTPIGEAVDYANTPFATDATVILATTGAAPRTVSVASSGRISVG
jgi:prepilin-type N-terminal cleavage/methylation domain-containing protein